jgi:hypothetical protein
VAHENEPRSAWFCTTPEWVERPISTDERVALERFSCADLRFPWTDTAEIINRERLAEELAIDDELHAFGFWNANNLLAIGAWRLDPGDPRGVARCLIVATRSGVRRRGLGLAVKRRVLDEAQAAGALAVSSLVHWDGRPRGTSVSD